MNPCAPKLVCFFLLWLVSQGAGHAQYILNGSAQQNACNCYTLTQSTTNQSGSVWNSNKIDLRTSFDYWFNVFLGCNDASGADGIVFILQPLSTSVGTTGEGMGFGGVSPSVGIALDTWQNPNQNDPAYDHISIQANGITNHNSDLVGPVPISSTSDNVEDCQWHRLRISWNSTTHWLRAYFDGVLRVEKQVDLVATIFNNDPRVYWGFTGATGGSVNLQQFCTALNPIFNTNVPANVGCEGTPLVFSDASESFAPITAYNWSFGDGTFSTIANPPPHLYPAPGTYTVKLKIKGQDGCETDSSRTVTIAPKPYASLQVFDTCSRFLPRYAFTAPGLGTTLQWQLDGGAPSAAAPSLLAGLPAGAHQLKVSASSNYGCGSDAVASASFFIKPAPKIDATVNDGCVGEKLLFQGAQNDNQTTIRLWQWAAGQQLLTGQTVQPVFSQVGNYPIQLWAVADNECPSDTVTRSVRVAHAFVTARDTTLMRNVPAQLQVQTNGSVLWQPSTGLSDPTVATPVVTLGNDQAYVISSVTPEGCTAADTLHIRVFNGPAVYIPTAFTPNGDGLNDQLLPVYVGIREVKLFAIFDRWGHRLFATSNTGEGWKGSAVPGTYVWLVNAVTDGGHPLILKGTVTLLR